MKKEREKKSSDKNSKQSAYWQAHNAKKLAFAAENEITPAMLEVEYVDRSADYVDNSPKLKIKSDGISPMFNKVGSFSTVNRRTPSAVALDMIEQCRMNARAEQTPYGRVEMMEDEDEVRLDGWSSGRRMQSSSQKHLSIPGGPHSSQGHRAESSPRDLMADV